MIIPNAYRDSLGETFTIGPTRDFQGIALYPDSVYDQLLSDIVSMNQRKPVVQKFAMQFSKLSYREMQADAQGRLLLPAKLRQRMLEDAKELEISGALDYIRVVGIEKADAEDAFFSENLDEILEQLGNLDE
jgi:MraZ protein